MDTEQSIAIMKALGDPSRLAMVHSLLERSHYVEELAERHGLAASTVSFHLRKLEKAGLVVSRKEQYYVVVAANEALFDTTLRQIVTATRGETAQQERRMAAYRRKVIETFFTAGMLTKLPAQHKKRLIVLEQFAGRFEPGRRYNEQAVTTLLLPLYDDYCTIRRLLVDAGLIRREGGLYWREEIGTELARPEPLPAKGREAKSSKEPSRRAQLKRVCKESASAMGVYQIRNRVNGKIFVAASRNLAADRNSRLFQLQRGTVVFNRELQHDVGRCGAESFEFSVLAEMEKPQAGVDPVRALKALEREWIERLQPFGEHGYNSPPTSRRSKEKLELSGAAKSR